ncbi:MAG: DUF4296 domain-containing protein [Ilyomonas sp.]
MRLSILFIFLLFFIACSNGNKIPDNVLTPEKMKPVLWDMILADQYILSKDPNQDSIKSQAIVKFEEVFAKHKIDKESFYNSFRYYEEHPDLLKVLMDSAAAYGTRERSDVSRPKNNFKVE